MSCVYHNKLKKIGVELTPPDSEAPPSAHITNKEAHAVA